MSNIPAITPDDDFVEVKECDYKGEHYSVRDNGAIMRHAREGKPHRKDDETWTFGKKDDATGYMIFCSARVHIIVATAFFGEHDSKVYVVDHKDTNRCNNRPTNLRWLTRLENALSNPATRKKIIFLCGSIENFIKDPSCLRDATGTNQDVAWMRTVTAEEAKAAYARVMEWAEKPSSETPSQGGKMGEWLYQTQTNEWQPDFLQKDRPNVPPTRQESNKPLTVQDLQFTDGTPLLSDDTYYGRSMIYDPWGNIIGPKPTREEKKLLKENNVSEYFETSNRLAQQIGWKPYTKPEFPCCPDKVGENPLQEYAARLKEGAEFVVAVYGASTVYKYTICNNQLLVVTKIQNSVKNFALTRITWNGKVFVHESMGTYFEENGVMAEYTIAQGKEWDGPDSIDNYC